MDLVDHPHNKSPQGTPNSGHLGSCTRQQGLSTVSEVMLVAVKVVAATLGAEKVVLAVKEVG